MIFPLIIAIALLIIFILDYTRPILYLFWGFVSPPFPSDLSLRSTTLSHINLNDSVIFRLFKVFTVDMLVMECYCIFNLQNDGKRKYVAWMPIEEAILIIQKNQRCFMHKNRFDTIRLRAIDLRYQGTVVYVIFFLYIIFSNVSHHLFYSNDAKTKGGRYEILFCT